MSLSRKVLIDMTGAMKAFNSQHDSLHWTAFAIIISLAIILRIVGFQGYSGHDPDHYAMLARDLANGLVHIPVYDGVPGYPLRIGLYGPAAIFIKVFGLSELTIVAYPFLLSIAGCLLAYVMARRIFGPLAGLTAMGLLAVLPTDIRMASLLYPDALRAFWGNVGILFTMLALSEDRKFRSGAHALLGGICFGVAWLITESVVYLAPFVVLFVLNLQPQLPLRARLFSLAWIGIGVMIIVGTEVVFLNAVAGDPLFRLRESQRNIEMFQAWFDLTDRELARRVFVDGPKELLTYFSALPFLAVIALAKGATLRDRRFVPLGVWFITLLLWLNFGPVSLKAYAVLPLWERYAYPMLLPVVLLVSGLASVLLSSSGEPALDAERAFWASSLLATYLVISALGLPAILLGSRPEDPERRVAATVAQSDIVYTNFRSACHLIFFRMGLLPEKAFSPCTAPTTIPYEHITPGEMAIGAYVLVNKGMTGKMVLSPGYQPPTFATKPPETWRRVWSSQDAILYRIGQ
jgi:hypothetical protein